MDKKYLIKTLIRWDHKLGDEPYVQGRISGMQLVISNDTKAYANKRVAEGYVLQGEFTAIEYDDFMNIVEKHYPGLCKFDYKESE